MITADLVLLADAANTTVDGRLNILGEFNVLLSDVPPWAIAGRVLVFRLTGNAGDVGECLLGLRLLGPDGNLIWASGDSSIPFPETRLPGTPARLQGIIPLPPISLPAEGPYELEILVDKRRAGCVDLHCVRGGDLSGHAQR